MHTKSPPIPEVLLKSTFKRVTSGLNECARNKSVVNLFKKKISAWGNSLKWLLKSARE